MGPERSERRLTAIMFSDIAGYTRLMAENEEVGLRVRVRHRDLLGSLARDYGGAVVDENGDELMLAFPSAVDAVNCALATQEVLRDDPVLKLRIGIHLGDVVFGGGRVYGDGVNVAARLRPLAKPGGICISADVQNLVRNQSNVEIHPLGTHELKNVPSPTALFHVTGAPAAPRSAAESTRTIRSPALRWAAGTAVVVALLAIAVIFFEADQFVPESELEQPGAVTERESAAQPAVREKSIAVLPFENLSRDAANEPLAVGIHDDILTQIAKISALKVISRTSVMGYVDTTKNVKTIGAELGVATLLEGGIQRAGDRMRINVQLIDAATDEHLWADTYDRRLTAANIFAIQTEIAAAIADALRATLSTEERELISAVPTENMAALEEYFRGKQNMAKRSTAALAEAIGDFNRAIELDPKFALAYVGLADSHILQIAYSYLPPDEMLAKAQAAIDRALALDERLAEAYTSLGQIERERTNYEAAEAAFKRSLELNPNYATAYHWYSSLLVGPLERRGDALELGEKAAELDPRSPIVLAAVGHHYASVGRFDESLRSYRKSIEIDPDFANGYLLIASHYWWVEGQLDEAVRWLRKSVSIDPGAVGFAYLGWLFLDLGDLERAEYWIERAKESTPRYFLTNLTSELFHLHQGDLSAALEYGRRAFETEEPWTLRLSSFEPVRIREIRAGRYLGALAALEKLVPELLNEDPPEIGIRTYRSAIDLALILSKIGERERADRILESSLEYIQQIPRLGGEGYAVSDVEIYALQGNKQKALSALRQAIDEGWRDLWWYSLEQNPALESLHDEPEFQAMVEEVEADMAAQLERVREMERNGELEPIPEVSATPH